MQRLHLTVLREGLVINREAQRLKRLYFKISCSVLFNFADKIIAYLTLKFWNFPSDFGVSSKTKKTYL